MDSLKKFKFQALGTSPGIRIEVLTRLILFPYGHQLFIILSLNYHSCPTDLSGIRRFIYFPLIFSLFIELIGVTMVN